MSRYAYSPVLLFCISSRRFIFLSSASDLITICWYVHMSCEPVINWSLHFSPVLCIFFARFILKSCRSELICFAGTCVRLPAACVLLWLGLQILVYLFVRLSICQVVLYISLDSELGYTLTLTRESWFPVGNRLVCRYIQEEAGEDISYLVLLSQYGRSVVDAQVHLNLLEQQSVDAPCVFTSTAGCHRSAPRPPLSSSFDLSFPSPHCVIIHGPSRHQLGHGDCFC